MTMSNMSCHEAKRKVYEYLGEELDGTAKQEVDGHLSGCSRCAEEFHLERTISDMIISTNPRLIQSSDFYNRISNSLRSEIE